MELILKMGLDMYLEAEYYIWSNENVEVKGIDVEGLKLKKIVVDVGYWRKANQIHNWFVENTRNGIDDCQRSYVSRHYLEELLRICKEILENCELVDNETITNDSIARELLPTQSGFFFGGTEYDEWYYRDIEETVKILEKALELPKIWDFYYQSSW